MYACRPADACSLSSPTRMMSQCFSVPPFYRSPNAPIAKCICCACPMVSLQPKRHFRSELNGQASVCHVRQTQPFTCSILAGFSAFWQKIGVTGDRIGRFNFHTLSPFSQAITANWAIYDSMNCGTHAKSSIFPTKISHSSMPHCCPTTRRWNGSRKLSPNKSSNRCTA